MSDYNLPISNNYMGDDESAPDIYGTLPPHFLALKDRWAKETVGKARREAYFAGPNRGMTTKEISEQEDDLRAATVIQKVSPTLAKLNPDQANVFKERLFQDLSNRPPVPGQAKLNTPTLMQALAAALGAAFDPRNSGDILAAPLQSQLRQQEVDTQQGQMQYQSDMQAREERMRFNEGLINDQTRRDIAEQDANMDITKTNLGIEQFNVNSEMERRNQDLTSADRRYTADKAYEKSVDVAGINANSKVAVATMKRATAQEKVQIGILQKGSPEDRIQAYLNLQKISPDLYGDMSFEDVQAAARSLPPQSVQQMANANLANTKAEDMVATRQKRLREYDDKHDLAGVQKEHIRAQTDYRKVATKWLPLEMQSKINDRQARANQAAQRIEIMRSNSAKGGLTAAQVLSLDKTIMDVQADADGVETEIRLLTAALAKEQADGKDEDRITELSDAIDAALVQRQVSGKKLAQAKELKDAVDANPDTQTMKLARDEGLSLIKQKPQMAKTIRQRFKQKYGVEIGG
jgi:hypothetical protein